MGNLYTYLVLFELLTTLEEFNIKPKTSYQIYCFKQNKFESILKEFNIKKITPEKINFVQIVNNSQEEPVFIQYYNFPAENECTICYDRTIAYVSQCGHFLCEQCNEDYLVKKINECSSGCKNIFNSYNK